MNNEEEDESSAAVPQPTASSSTRGKTMYSTSPAVPLTSQMLATCLLYGNLYSGPDTDEARDSFFSKSSKLDIEDPYLQYLVSEFACRSGGGVGLSDRVASLKVLSRSAIRVHLATDARLQCMGQLPLPKLLLNYVSMKTVI